MHPKTGTDWTDLCAGGRESEKRGPPPPLSGGVMTNVRGRRVCRRRQRRHGVGCGTSERPRPPARIHSLSLRVAGSTPHTTFSSSAVDPATGMHSLRVSGRLVELSERRGTQAGPFGDGLRRSLRCASQAVARPRRGHVALSGHVPHRGPRAVQILPPSSMRRLCRAAPSGFGTALRSATCAALIFSGAGSRLLPRKSDGSAPNRHITRQLCASGGTPRKPIARPSDGGQVKE